jgi:beta-phosphoglucomutase-like phosphatase (HAD superfamily)
MARPFLAAIFDVDGVLVDSPHEKAWRESLRELMENEWSDTRDHTTWTPDAFTPRLYQQQVSGKPRRAGASAVLEYFGMGNDAARIEEYALRKQQMVVRLIEAGDFEVFPDALRFVVATKDAGLRLAIASSSKNAGLLLGKIRVDELAGMTLSEIFDVDVSGRDFAHGKPDPEMFLAAAQELGVDPRDAFVVEDATAGVMAAKRGGMAAIGIARADDASSLAEAGADVVVGSLDEIDPKVLAETRRFR